MSTPQSTRARTIGGTILFGPEHVPGVGRLGALQDPEGAAPAFITPHRHVGFGKGASSMIKGLRGATIWSEDLYHLLPFYRDLLGFKVGVQIEGFVVLGDPGTPTLALGTHSEVHGRNPDPARHMVGLSTDDVDADWKRLKGAGVEFVEDPTDYGTLRIATLKDPEGNLLQLLQPLRS